jgi:hypothetical protein
MKVVHIIPPIAELVKGRDVFFLLAPLTEREIEFWKGVQGYKILDNGAYEGVTVSPDVLLKQATEVGASEVILPDKLFDKDWTIKNTRECIEMFRGKFKIMVVAQGRSFVEWYDCAKELMNLKPDVIGIPKLAARFAPRKFLARKLRKKWKGLIHLLGFNALSELSIKEADRIDTKLAVKCAVAGKKLPYMSLDNLDIKKVNKVDIELALYNMKWLESLHYT